MPPERSMTEMTSGNTSFIGNLSSSTKPGAISEEPARAPSVMSGLGISTSAISVAKPDATRDSIDCVFMEDVSGFTFSPLLSSHLFQSIKRNKHKKHLIHSKLCVERLFVLDTRSSQPLLYTLESSSFELDSQTMSEDLWEWRQDGKRNILELVRLGSTRNRLRCLPNILILVRLRKRLRCWDQDRSLRMKHIFIANWVSILPRLKLGGKLDPIDFIVRWDTTHLINSLPIWDFRMLSLIIMINCYWLIDWFLRGGGTFFHFLGLRRDQANPFWIWRSASTESIESVPKLGWSGSSSYVWSPSS